MANPETEVQKFVTEPIIDLIEFDFTSIGGTAHVYIASSLNASQSKFTWQVNQYDPVDFTTSGFNADLTGGISEPSLTVASDTLFSLASWPNTDLILYRGVTVKRRRVFETSTAAVQPQIYYIKKVDSFSATEITFTLTPSRSFERLNRKSTRKLDL